MRGDEGSHAVIDAARNEDDPLFQQAREDVESPLAAARLLHNHGNKVERCLERSRHELGLDGFSKESLLHRSGRETYICLRVHHCKRYSAVETVSGTATLMNDLVDRRPDVA